MPKYRNHFRSLISGAWMVSAIWLVLPERVQSEERPRLERITFGPIGEIEPNISPDGHWLAFQYFPKSELRSTQIWVMEISKGFRSARRLATRLDYAGEMSWSPDSKWISFISSEHKPGHNTNQIYKVSVLTNEVIQITAFPVGTLIGDSTTWSTNGLVGFERDGILYGISSTGGEEVQLLDMRAALSNQRPSYIRFSPAGKKLVFSLENAEQDQSCIWLADLETNSFRQLTDLHFDLFPSWIDEEHIVFTRQNEKKRSEIEVMSLRTKEFVRITSNHVDLTPFIDPSGSALYFSREGHVPKELRNADFFVGFHIWRMPIGRVGNPL